MSSESNLEEQDSKQRSNSVLDSGIIVSSEQLKDKGITKLASFKDIATINPKGLLTVHSNQISHSKSFQDVTLTEKEHGEQEEDVLSEGNSQGSVNNLLSRGPSEQSTNLHSGESISSSTESTNKDDSKVSLDSSKSSIEGHSTLKKNFGSIFIKGKRSFAKEHKKTRTGLRNIIFKYLIYIIRVMHMSILSFVCDWTQIVRQPINSFLLFVIIPVVNIAFLNLSIIFHLFDEMGGINFINKISDKHFHGLSVINWFNPSILLDADLLVYEGFRRLGKINGSKVFSIPVAKLLLTLSTLTYERPSTISKFAKKWGLIMELAHINNKKGDGVFIFYEKEANVIVLIFKGTDPFDLYDLHIDCTVQKVDARPHVFGQVHEGFYRTLFLAREYHGTKKKKLPYKVILTALEGLVRKYDIKNASLWLSGHSLGGALASLFYARLLKVPEDMNERLNIEGVYTFGSPRVGNFAFAQEVRSFSNIPISRAEKVKIWRVANAWDFIASMPFGYDGLYNDYLNSTGQSILDYCHIGNLTHLHYNQEVVFEDDHSILYDSQDLNQFEANVADSILALPLTSLSDILFNIRLNINAICNLHKNFWENIIWLLPFPILDHCPASYMRNFPKDDNAKKQGSRLSNAVHNLNELEVPKLVPNVPDRKDLLKRSRIQAVSLTSIYEKGETEIHLAPRNRKTHHKSSSSLID